MRLISIKCDDSEYLNTLYYFTCIIIILKTTMHE